jgi:hypothetical protein
MDASSQTDRGGIGDLRHATGKLSAEEVSGDLECLAALLMRRAAVRDPLTIVELKQLARMLDNLSRGRGSLAGFLVALEERS